MISPGSTVTPLENVYSFKTFRIEATGVSGCEMWWERSLRGCILADSLINESSFRIFINDSFCQPYCFTSSSISSRSGAIYSGFAASVNNACVKVCHQIQAMEGGQVKRCGLRQSSPQGDARLVYLFSFPPLSPCPLTIEEDQPIVRAKLLP